MRLEGLEGDMYKYYYVVGGALALIGGLIIANKENIKSHLEHSVLFFVVLMNSAWGYTLFQSYNSHIAYNVIGYCVIISQLMLLTRDADNGKLRGLVNDLKFHLRYRLFV